MSNGLLDDILVGGKSAFGPDAPVGTTVTGVIKDITRRQATDLQTKAPKFWDDGNPAELATITLQTDKRDDEEDDGIRTVHIKLWGAQKTALRDASQKAKGAPSVGDTFTATYTGDGKRTNPGFNPPKLYAYEIQKGSPLADSLGVPAQAAPAAPAQAAPAGLDAAKAEQVQKLIGLAMTDEQIAGALDGVTAQQVAGIRLQAAAGGQAGF